MPAGGLGSDNVVLEAIADVEDLFGSEFEGVLAVPKNLRVGFFVTDLAGDEEVVEEIVEICFSHDAAHALVPVGEEGGFVAPPSQRCECLASGGFGAPAMAVGEFFPEVPEEGFEVGRTWSQARDRFEHYGVPIAPLAAFAI